MESIAIWHETGRVAVTGIECSSPIAFESLMKLLIPFKSVKVSDILSLAGILSLPSKYKSPLLSQWTLTLYTEISLRFQERPWKGWML